MMKCLILDSELLCDYNIVEGNKLHLFVREDAPSTPQQATPDFFEQLQKFLEKHFTPSDAEKVLEEFRKVSLFVHEFFATHNLTCFQLKFRC